MDLSDSIQKHISNGSAQMSGILLHAVDQLIPGQERRQDGRRGLWAGLYGWERGLSLVASACPGFILEACGWSL